MKGAVAKVRWMKGAVASSSAHLQTTVLWCRHAVQACGVNWYSSVGICYRQPHGMMHGLRIACVCACVRACVRACARACV